MFSPDDDISSDEEDPDAGDENDDGGGGEKNLIRLSPCMYNVLCATKMYHFIVGKFGKHCIWRISQKCNSQVFNLAFYAIAGG